MDDNKQTIRSSGPTSGFWSSRAGFAFVVFLAVAGVLLAYEHRIHLFTESGFLIVLLTLCVGMHFFMHRGHGGRDNDADEGES